LVAAGQYHVIALCTDGTLVSWGNNQHGQLGNSSTANGFSPVKIGSFGALSGKSVKAISAGATHSVALCADGTLAAWGSNSQSQLGVKGITQSNKPVAVAPPARRLAGLESGAYHNLMRFTDGSMAAWGGNAYGQLGSGSTNTSAVAVDVDTSALEHRGIIMDVASGCASSHNLAVFAVPVNLPAHLANMRMKSSAGLDGNLRAAGDGADLDRDGIPKLVEYAFGLNPDHDNARKVPQPKRVGDCFELRYSRAHLAPDMEFGAEWSPDLSPGSWRNVPDSGDDGEHVFSVPLNGASRLFMRHRVRSFIPD
jgi:hypothetical protein